MGACFVFCELRIVFLNIAYSWFDDVVNLRGQTQSCLLSACCSNELLINTLMSLTLDSTPSNSHDLNPRERHPTGTL